MKYNFKNIGSIDDGTVEVADLTIICGPNNVGKTYLTYCIYGFFKNLKNSLDLLISDKLVESLKEEGNISVDLTEYQDNLNKYLKESSEEFSSNLANYFNVDEDFFNNSKVDFSSDKIFIDIDNEYKSIITFGENTVYLEKEAKNTKLYITFAKEETEIKTSFFQEKNNYSQFLKDVINKALVDCLFSKTLLKPFVITSERTGISLFYKELDFSKNSMFDFFNTIKVEKPIEYLNKIYSRYAKPIQHNIRVIRDYENISRKKSFILNDIEKYKPVLEALKDLTGGEFTSVDKQVFFKSENESNRESVKVPVYMSSSSIKSLFLMDLYINFLAEKQGLLVIDEPELNLHPDNQRKMATLLVRLVNSGIKVLITTHSDYLIKEINNRIMLSNDFSEKKEIIEKAKLGKLDELQPDKVKAFSLKGDHKIREVDIDKYGINLDIFDDLISDANEFSDSIYYSIKD